MSAIHRTLEDVSKETLGPADFGPRSCRLAADLRDYFAAFSVYAALATVFFARGLFAGFSSHYIGRGTDPTQMTWALEWWPYAIGHHVNLFLSNVVWAPVGFNVTSMKSMPLVAFAAYPLSRSFGLVATYNVLALLAVATAALCAFGLCRLITGRFFSSLLGGYAFGFSGYMLDQLLGHLNLILVFAIPLIACVILARVNRSLERFSFVVLLVLTLSAQFFVDPELFTVGVMFGTSTLAAFIYFSPAPQRHRLYADLPLIAAALVGVAVIISPYLYYYLAFTQSRQPIWSSETFSTDLLNFLIPTPANLLGANRWLEAVSGDFRATLMERGAYIALPVLAILVSWVRRNWSKPICRALILVLVAAAAATLGPWVHFRGSAIAIAPWVVFARMPVLKHVLPARLMVMISLVLAVIIALWMADTSIALPKRIVVAALAVFMMLPNPSARFWTTALEAPAFFADHTCQSYLSPDDIVLALPWGEWGTSMLWQAECGMCFRNVGGWTGVQRFTVRRWPIVQYFLGAPDLVDPQLQLKAFLANTGVSAIVIDDQGFRAAQWNSLVQSLGIAPKRVSGVSFYRIPPGLLDAYRAMSGLEMESRANQVRFDMAVRAANAYLASGQDLRRINVSRLAELSLLPFDWRLQKDNLASLLVVPMSSDQIAIVEYGSFASFSGVIAKYQKQSNVIYYPFPQVLWEADPPSLPIRLMRAVLVPPASGPVDGESMGAIAIPFTRGQLAQAATSIANAPKERISTR
jgi:hypothetical protein